MQYGNLKIGKVYWSTKEVSQKTGIPDYTLRYWESVIPSLHVPRNRAGKRAWRKHDIEMVEAIQAMLKESPEGVSQISKADVAKRVATKAPIKVETAPPAPQHNPDPEVLRKLREEVLLAMSKLRK
ncbi:MerR family transcriptional regulator [uncultured Fibrobacter sp.]|uniref:MerR family transcriptional regulator n=1 Tax=uncultured Fibrobacter sp. TaxID=261512 RepID=UPI0025DBD727|nr:MerR family transcriptional regulator [uncultured Fibrobacter sp.]